MHEVNEKHVNTCLEAIHTNMELMNNGLDAEFQHQWHLMFMGDFARKTRAELTRLCRRLGVDCTEPLPELVDNATHHAVHFSREHVIWPKHLVLRVHRALEAYPVLFGKT